jgi:hypothetical protein
MKGGGHLAGGFKGLGCSDLGLGAGRGSADLTEDQVDTLWTQACPTSDSLLLCILALVACGSPDGAGVE